jgi:ribosomal RNA methyltransferase Nop2
MANIEARSRALDEAAAAEAELDAEELRQAAFAVDDEDIDMDDDDEVDKEFRLPTAAEREEETLQGGPDVQTVQHRMRHCVRVLGNFKKRTEKDRWAFMFSPNYINIDH